MGRKTSRINNQKKNISSKPQVYSKSNTPNTQKKQSSFLGSIVQGVAIGAGASIGSAMIGRVLSVENNEINQQHNQDNQPCHSDYNYKEDECNFLFKQFNECANNYNDVANCKIILDSYKNCIKYNQKQI